MPTIHKPDPKDRHYRRHARNTVEYASIFNECNPICGPMYMAICQAIADGMDSRDLEKATGIERSSFLSLFNSESLSKVLSNQHGEGNYKLIVSIYRDKLASHFGLELRPDERVKRFEDQPGDGDYLLDATARYFDGRKNWYETDDALKPYPITAPLRGIFLKAKQTLRVKHLASMLSLCESAIDNFITNPNGIWSDYNFRGEELDSLAKKLGLKLQSGG